MWVFFFFKLFCSVILAVILSVFQLPAWSQHAKPVAKTCCLRFRLLPCGVLRTLLSGRSLLLQRKAPACNSPGCSPSTVTLWNPTCLPVAPLDHMFKFQTSRHSKSDHNYCKILSLATWPLLTSPLRQKLQCCSCWETSHFTFAQ